MGVKELIVLLLAAGSGRPVSTSRDAMLARDLLQHEMDLIIQEDEEMARQLQEEMNHDDEPSHMARSLAMFMPGGVSYMLLPFLRFCM